MAALLPCMWRRAKYTVVGLQKAAHYNGAFCITSTAPHPRLSPIRPRASSSLSFDDSFCTCPALPKPGAGQQCIILGVKPYSGGGGRTRVMTRLLNDEQNQLALHRSAHELCSLCKSASLTHSLFCRRTGYPAHTLILFR